MKKKIKKLVVFILTLSIVVGTAAFMAFAEDEVIRDTEMIGNACETAIVESGDWWSFDSNTGTLNIWGTGPMEDFGLANAPWYSVRNSITEVVIGNGLTSISEAAFMECISLADIVIPSNIQTIGNYAFYYCTGLTSVEINSTLTDINACTFYGCSALEEITIPSTVKNIGFEAFRGCTSLTEIEIPASTEYIDNSAFRGCSGVQNITVASGNTFYDSRNDCNAIIESSTDKLLWGCSKTVIPSDVTAIGQNAFADCISLEKITIPSGVNSIGVAAFLGCSSMTEITIPYGVTSIGPSAFDSCTNLKTVRIMGNINSIADGLFWGCAKLETIFLPVSVVNIENSAFSYCDSMSDVYYTGSENDRNQINFNYNNEVLSGATWHYNNSGAFADVNKSDWYMSDVLFVFNRGIMTGMGGTLNFAPVEPLKREQFAIILYRLENTPAVTYESKFHDVPSGTWYTDAIIWAYKNKIITGYENGYFGVGDNITREQFATMLYRYAKDYKKMDVSVTADISGYLDKNYVSSWALDAMKWAVGNGIITGKDNKTRLDPIGNAARCECAAMIQRFLN